MKFSERKPLDQAYDLLMRSRMYYLGFWSRNESRKSGAKIEEELAIFSLSQAVRDALRGISILDAALKDNSNNPWCNRIIYVRNNRDVVETIRKLKTLRDEVDTILSQWSLVGYKAPDSANRKELFDAFGQLAMLISESVPSRRLP